MWILCHAFHCNQPIMFNYHPVLSQHHRLSFSIWRQIAATLTLPRWPKCRPYNSRLSRSESQFQRRSNDYCGKCIPHIAHANAHKTSAIWQFPIIQTVITIKHRQIASPASRNDTRTSTGRWREKLRKASLFLIYKHEKV